MTETGDQLVPRRGVTLFVCTASYRVCRMTVVVRGLPQGPMRAALVARTRHFADRRLQGGCRSASYGNGMVGLALCSVLLVLGGKRVFRGRYGVLASALSILSHYGELASQKEGGLSASAIARKLGVSPVYIRAALNAKAYLCGQVGRWKSPTPRRSTVSGVRFALIAPNTRTVSTVASEPSGTLR